MDERSGNKHIIIIIIVVDDGIGDAGAGYGVSDSLELAQF